MFAKTFLVLSTMGNLSIGTTFLKKYWVTLELSKKNS